MQPSEGTIPAASVSLTTPAATAVVGNAELANVATFEFTPATALSVYGGRIEISGPSWYTSLASLMGGSV